MHYGNCCNICGEEDYIVLTIDHINQDGASHRKKIGLNAGTTFYRWLIKNNFPKGYRLLCRNCNWQEYHKNDLINIVIPDPNKNWKQDLGE